MSAAGFPMGRPGRCWRRSAIVLAVAAAFAAPLRAAPLPYANATGEFRVNDTTLDKQVPFSIATTPSGEVVVGWNSRGQDGDIEGIFVRRFDAQGRPLTGEIPVNVNTRGVQFHSTVTTDAAGNFAVAWNSISTTNGDIDVFYRLFNAAGQPLTGELRLATTTAGTQLVLGGAMNADGRFVYAWTSEGQDGSSYGAYARVFSPTGEPLSAEIPVNATTASRQLPSPGGVAIEPDGEFVVAWESYRQDGSEFGVYARRFDALGAPLTGDIAVTTTTAGSQRPGGVAIDPDGDFVVTWRSEEQDGSGYGAYARVFAADGTPVTPELQVNQFTTGEQRSGGVSMDAQGNFAVVWRSDGADGDGLAVAARRYTREGVPLTPERILNVVTARVQFPVGVAMDADGDFTTVWASGGQDGSDLGVYARRQSGAQEVDLALALDAPRARIRTGSPFPLVLDASSLASPSTLTGLPALDQAIGLADAVKIATTLPGGATLQTVEGPGWSCSPSALLVNCAYAPALAAGQPAPPLTLNLLAGSQSGAWMLGSALDAAQYDPVQSNNQAGATVTVCDGGQLQFARPSYRRQEGIGLVTIPVSRSGTVCGAASVRVSTVAGSALAAADYTAAATTLQWGDNQTGTRFFEFALLDDALDEALEFLDLQLDQPVNAVLGSAALTRVEIADDDAPPILAMGADFSVIEGAAGVAFRLQLDQPSGRDVVARLQLGGTATRGQDYAYNSGLSFTIPAGSTVVDIPLNNSGARIVDDGLAEPAETISLTLTAVTGAALGAATQTLTITDND